MLLLSAFVGCASSTGSDSLWSAGWTLTVTQVLADDLPGVGDDEDDENATSTATESLNLLYPDNNTVLNLPVNETFNVSSSGVLLGNFWAFNSTFFTDNATDTGLDFGMKVASPSDSIEFTEIEDGDRTTVAAQFTSSATLTTVVSSVDDDIDDSDQTFFVFVRPTWLSTSHGIVSIPTSVYDFMRVTVTHYDDDTAGVTLANGEGDSITAYKADRSEFSDTNATSSNTFSNNQDDTTWEDGSVNASFYVVLNSEPVDTVWVTVTTAKVTNNGFTRAEGFPEDSTYDITEEAATAPWLEGQYTQDISNIDTGSLVLTFTTSDWNVGQWVTISGLDDLVDDGDQDYDVFLTMVRGSCARVRVRVLCAMFVFPTVVRTLVSCPCNLLYACARMRMHNPPHTYPPPSRTPRTPCTPTPLSASSRCRS